MTDDRSIWMVLDDLVKTVVSLREQVARMDERLRHMDEQMKSMAANHAADGERMTRIEALRNQGKGFILALALLPAALVAGAMYLWYNFGKGGQP